MIGNSFLFSLFLSFFCVKPLFLCLLSFLSSSLSREAPKGRIREVKSKVTQSPLASGGGWLLLDDQRERRRGPGGMGK